MDGLPLNSVSYRKIPKNKILRFDATPGFKGWEQFFSKESVTHPAKINLNLLRWILETYMRPGNVVLDPMAGTGSTIILAALMGRHGVAVEYESRFCDMIRANISLTERQTTLTPKGWMTCIRGDARELSRLLGVPDAIITSPPYSETVSSGEGPGASGKHPPVLAGRLVDYSDDPQNIGNLPHGDIDSIVTSPPFGPSTRGGGIFREGYKAPGEEEVSDPGLPQRHGRPLSDDLRRNIDNLRYGEVDAVITSPPYEASVKRGDEGPSAHGHQRPTYDERISEPKVYSNDPNNIGNLKSETYLEAMLQCYREFYKVLKNSGKLIIVIKNFIRDKAVVRLDSDTIKLCEATGFTLKDRWYFRLPTRSFWRILYRHKYPEVPEVEFEDVLVFEKLTKR